MKKIVIVIYLILLSAYTFSQVDSILNLIRKESNDSIKFRHYQKLYFNYETTNTDSAKIFIDKAYTIAKKLNDDELMADYCLIYARYNNEIEDYEKSIEYFNKAYEHFHKKRELKVEAEILTNIATIYNKIGVFEKSIENYQKALKIDEEIGDSAGMAYNYNNLGILHRKLGRNDRALEYNEKSLEIKLKLGDKNGAATSYNNIGTILCSNGDYEEGLIYLEKSLKIKEELNDIYGVANAYGNIGRIYTKQEKYEMAHEYYQKTLELKTQIKDNYGIAISYAVMADNQYMAGNYSKAVDYCKECIKIVNDLGLIEVRIEAYNIMSASYEKLGNINDAYKFYKLLIVDKDSLFNKEKAKQIEELESIYQNEKKQLEIDNLEKQELLNKQIIITQKEENKKQEIIIIAVVLGLLFLIFILIITIRMFRQKKKANELLEQKNNEIEAQRDLAAQQRDLIAEQKKDITDSIEYAFMIQSAIFPDPEDIQLVLKDYFILYKPRDIVSGDFYWINKQQDKIIIIAADCTGHGVPGAFMSMLGIAFLNEIVNKENITNPARILDRLRENIILALKQKGGRETPSDGMDVAAITIGLKQRKLEFAGANNPLYMIKNNEIIETKGDKMPVSIYSKMHAFTCHNFDLEEGDNIYIFSDGYADQFGGPGGKKFKYKNFKDVLLSIKDLPMTEQREILDKKFENWRGDIDQIDDVLVMGVRIK